MSGSEPKDISRSELLKSPADAQYGRLPYEVVTSGALASLGRSDWAAYTVIAAHIGGSSWTAFPSLATIARCAGISHRTATRAVARLEKVGLLTIERGGGRSRFNRYTLSLNPDTKDGTVSMHKPGHQDVPFSDSKAGQTEDERVTERETKGDNSTSKPCHVGVTRKAEEQNSRKAGPKEAAAGIDEEVVHALRRAGIGEPTLSELANTSGINPELVNSEVARLNGTDKGTGILVQNLRSAAVKVAQDIPDRESRLEETRQAGVTTYQKLRNQEKAVAEAKDLIKKLSADKIEDFRQQVLKSAPEILRGVWATANPLGIDRLALEIARVCRNPRKRSEDGGRSS